MTETKCYRHQWADVHFVEGDDRALYHIEQDHDMTAVGCRAGSICTRCWKRYDRRLDNHASHGQRAMNVLVACKFSGTVLLGLCPGCWAELFPPEDEP